MVLLFAAGITVVILSAGIASISVMRMKPGEILARNELNPKRYRPF